MLTLRENPVRITYLGQNFESGVYDQIKMACRLPVSEWGEVMPDGHSGYGVPIGGVVALKNAVAPGFVGYDIACRMRLNFLAITPKYALENREFLLKCILENTSFGVGSTGKRIDHPIMHSNEWEEIDALRDNFNLAKEQLGSSGGGNHFADLVIGKVECANLPSWIPVENTGDQFVALMTHSGSRGTGHKTATHFIKRAREYTDSVAQGIPNGYEWLDMGTDAGKEYWTAMNLLGKYAQANHQLIHEGFLKSAGIEAVGMIENHHNFAWKLSDGTILHRKGATPADLGRAGIIPGSSGTASYIVYGLGDETTSSSHGAGRVCSRAQAKKRFDAQAYAEHMAKNDILTHGVGKDETYAAYKDIEAVMEAQNDRVKIVAKMKPTIVVMGGAADDGD